MAQEEKVIDDEELLQQINDKLPADVCNAHPFMILYIQKIANNINNGFKQLNTRLDPIEQSYKKNNVMKDFWAVWKDRIYGFTAALILILISKYLHF